MRIGERIKRRRLELGWSQRDLAERMNYSHHSTLARIETGKVDVSQTRIVQFSNVLGVSIAYLMGWDESEDKQKQPAQGELSIKKKEFMQKVEAMTDDQIERLEKILALVEQTEI